jgi:gas vesicle protein
MAQDVLDELLQTEKEAADLIARAEKDVLRRAKAVAEEIRQRQQELKQELKQKRQTLKTELETEQAQEAVKARKKTETKLEKLKVARPALNSAAEYLVQKILA